MESRGTAGVDVKYTATIEEVKESIDNGNPCILHGMFTRSGQIVVAREYDFRGLIVNDP
jgi:hypothetical protein